MYMYICICIYMYMYQALGLLLDDSRRVPQQTPRLDTIISVLAPVDPKRRPNYYILALYFCQAIDLLYDKIFGHASLGGAGTMTI